jgi:hypothetical protein
VPDKTNIANIPTNYFLGSYPSWGDNERRLSFSDLKNEMSIFPYSRIKFTTSRKNNVVGQFFEVHNGAVTKLDVVDFGVIKNDSNNPNISTNKVFFVGKTYNDDRGTTCFVNMFTLIFSRSDDFNKEFSGV